ncbi:cathepsin L-like [Palaemon carinicauda]|uniref:cathepsin L-like n=1 Tax=Palaemon carinicauda TaxID=392227 RepID=UPI0035B5E56D
MTVLEKMMIMMMMIIAVILSKTAAYEEEISIVKEEWELFKIQHNKSYGGIVEEQFRMKMFLENKLKVIEHNKLFAQNKTSYSMKINHMSDMLPEEIVETMYGLRPEMNETLGSTFIPPDDDISLPSTVDWRLKGIVTPVKNQGPCGSCWAFSAVGSLEGQHARKMRHLISLSEQNLVDCCRYCAGCNGGLMSSAYRCILEEGGIESEFDYAYVAQNEVCKFDSRKVVATLTGWMHVGRSERELMKAVALAGPISAAIDASPSFLHYSSGIYYDANCSPTRLNHGVLVVGYGTERGMDYWLVKNSWSTLWGNQGYVKMARNRSNMCGIASLASYPLV